MNIRRITFITDKNAAELGFDSNPQLLKELLECLCDDKGCVSTEQLMSEEKKEKLDSFLSAYVESQPQFNKLKSQLSQVRIGDYFLIGKELPLDDFQQLEVQSYINALNEESSILSARKKLRKRIEEAKDEYGDVLKRYQIKTLRSDVRTFIGESNKINRICRFCSRSLDEGASFSHRAHAIPESLGNKSLFVNEECDDCNKFFGDNIEPALIEYLDIPRVFFGVRGKGGLKKIKRGSTTIEHTGGVVLVQPETIDKSTESQITLDLGAQKSHPSVNIYKALCKLTLSTVDSSIVPNLEETIKWIKSTRKLETSLPKVAVLVNPNHCQDRPSLTNYVRLDNEVSTPHVVSLLRVFNFFIVYVVPFSDSDNRDFSTDDNFSQFWKVFSNFNQLNGWQFQQLDSYEPQTTRNILKIKTGKP
mgnify:CR=1 FL=1